MILGNRFDDFYYPPTVLRVLNKNETLYYEVKFEDGAKKMIRCTNCKVYDLNDVVNVLNNASKELNITAATANDDETSINEVSRVSTTSKKSTKAIEPIRQSLNDSTSTRHSNRNTKKGNQVGVLTTGILLSDRNQQVRFLIRRILSTKIYF